MARPRILSERRFAELQIFAVPFLAIFVIFAVLIPVFEDSTQSRFVKIISRLIRKYLKKAFSEPMLKM